MLILFCHCRPIFNWKYNNIFMSLFTHHLYISQWKICLLHTASLNNIRKNGSSPLICILSSILEFCIQHVVPIMLRLSHSQATSKGVLWRTGRHFPNILSATLRASRFLLFIYCRHKSAMTLHLPHCTIINFLSYFVKHSFYHKCSK